MASRLSVRSEFERSIEKKSLTELDLEIQAVIVDPSTSSWLRTALQTGLERDPVDSANDAEILNEYLARRCDAALSSQ